MITLLILIAVVIIINALPAFAPPTWTVLVFYYIQYDLHPALLVILGALAATMGRAFLAWYFRRFADLVPTRFSRNMVAMGSYLERSTTTKYSVLGLFFLSPLSSAQLFEAAGLMKTVALKPLLTAFTLGRLMSYSIYLTTASMIGSTDFGTLLIDHLKSPWAIALQFAMIAALIGLGMVDWKKVLKR